MHVSSSNIVQLASPDQRHTRNLSDVCTNALPNEPPKYFGLCAREKTHWKTVAGSMPWLRDADVNSVWLLVKIRSQIEQLENSIDYSEKPAKVAQSYRLLDMAQQRYMVLLTQLGGTYKSRVSMMTTLAATLGTDTTMNDDEDDGLD